MAIYHIPYMLISTDVVGTHRSWGTLELQQVGRCPWVAMEIPTLPRTLATCSVDSLTLFFDEEWREQIARLFLGYSIIESLITG